MGYANVDNLAFDVLGSLWGVTDMTTGIHNAVGDGPSPSALPMNHNGVGSAALAANPTFLRTGLEILTLDGSGVFPSGSGCASREPIAREHRQGSNRDIARPAVIGIQRKQQ
jgi:secreted PhoX family phosphatase